MNTKKSLDDMTLDEQIEHLDDILVDDSTWTNVEIFTTKHQFRVLKRKLDEQRKKKE